MLQVRKGRVSQSIQLPPLDAGTETFFVFGLSRADIVGFVEVPGISVEFPNATWKGVSLPRNVQHVHRDPGSSATEVTLVSRGEPQELLKILATGPNRGDPVTIFEPPPPPAPLPDAPQLTVAVRGRQESDEEFIERVTPEVPFYPPPELAALTQTVGDPGDVCLDLTQTVQTTVAEDDLVEQFLDADAYYDALWAALAGGTDPLDPGRKFFADLDSETHHRLFHRRILCSDPDDCYEFDYRKEAIAGLATTLHDRLVERAETFCGNPDLEQAAYVPTIEAKSGYLIYVEALFRGVIEKHFGVDQGFDANAFEKTFEEFANGELRLEVVANNTKAWACQPSTGFYYLFAEFALQYLDVHPNDAFWTKIVEVLVRTQPIFCTVYAPDPMPAKAMLQHYNACNFNWVARLFWKLGMKVSLEQAYDAVLISQNARHAWVAKHCGAYFPGLCPGP